MNIINFCKLYFNDKLIDYIPKEYFNIFYKLYNGKQNLINLNKLIGNIDEINSLDQNYKKEFVILLKIPFYFSKYDQYYLPNFNLNNSNIRVDFKINELNNLIIKKNNTYFVNEPFINVNLISDNIYQRDLKFNIQDQLIEQLQYVISKNVNDKTKFIDIPLDFKNNVKNLIFVLEKNSNIKNKDYNIYSSDNKNPIKSANIYLNNNQLLYNQNTVILNNLNYFKSDFFNYNIGINIINFQLNNNITNPNGNLNFLKLNNVFLRVTFNDNIFKNNDYGNIYVFAESYNILKFISGISNLIF